MINLALLIPVHPPKYQHIYHLIHRMLYSQIHHKFIDLILIFSNYRDYQNFEYKNAIIPIICENISDNLDGIVTFKKFYALKKLQYLQYEYIITCDSEIDIIIENFNLNNIQQQIFNIYDNKTIYAGEVHHDPNISKVIEYSSNLMNREHDIEKLKQITNNHTLYCWWSDLPVYKQSLLQGFFEQINFDKNINWHHFEHIIYLNYLALYHSFVFHNVTKYLKYNWSLESLYTDDIDVLKLLQYNRYSFSWSTPSLFDRHRDFLLNMGTFLLYHTDRPSWLNICHGIQSNNYNI